MKNTFGFPKNFIWGAATAAPQIEGAARADGKGESIWDHFAKRPGAVLGGATLDVACEHYTRYAEDFALMRDLGITHYRFSIAWPRLFPDGGAKANQPGFDFYQRLIDSMLEHGLTPWCTMFHWDLPQALEDKGGWRVRSTAEAFGVYANAVVRTYGDRIKNWITLNEVPAFIGHGYKLGLHAPGAKEPPAVINQAYHNAMLAHGLGVSAVRSYGGFGARVGIVHNPEITVPFSETSADIEATRAIFTQTNAHILAPIYEGRYPKDYLERCGAGAPRIEEGDEALIGQRTDFLGLNVYRGHFVRANPETGNPELLPLPAGYPRSEASWQYHVPQSMYWVTRFCHECYGAKDIFIAENGAGYFDKPDMRAEMPVIHGWPEIPSGTLLPGAGEVVDLHRCQYVRIYLQALHRAIREGFPVSGYFIWSFMDNFEWADGYNSRFGIVYVDYPTQRRQPKLSARLYSEIIRHNGVV